MSGQEKTVEENVDVDMAVGFFRALHHYFRANPKAMTSVLHTLSENLIDTITVSEDLKKHLGYAVGQLKVLANLIWYHDDEEVIQHLITNSPILEDIMNAITRLAWAYSKLENDKGVILGEVENLIEDAANTLYRIVEYIVTDTGSDP